MSDSEQGFETKNIVDFEIVKRITICEKPPSKSCQLVVKKAYCIYPNIKLYKYPSFIDRITVPQLELNNSIDKSEPLKALYCDSLPSKTLQSFTGRKVCIFNKFNENFALKHDITIFLKNVNLAVKNDMIRGFESSLQSQLSEPYPDFLTFTSNFEAGNLMAVFKSNSSLETYTYYLLLQNDTNTHGYNQWFFFYVRPNWQTIAEGSVTVRLVIMNLSKEIRYRSDLNLLTCQSGQWRINTPFLYYQNIYRRYNDKNLYTIDFQHTFDIEQSSGGTFFCLSLPYTYSRLTAFLQRVKEEGSGKYEISLQNIGESECRNQMLMVKIMHHRKQNTRKEQKAIIVVARQHPCETVSSFVVENLISCLLNPLTNTESSYIWYIFPMLNPDGVIHGHSRTNLNGYDLNRCWDHTQIEKCAQNQHVNREITRILAQHSCEYVIDLHGHSREFDCFGYFSQKNSITTRVNYLLSQKIKHYNFAKSKYGIAFSKRPTFRGQMLHRCHIANTITIETSLYGYQQQSKRHPWDSMNFTEIALGIISTIFEVKNMQWEQCHKIEFEILKLQKKCIKKTSIADQSYDSDSDPENEYLLETERQEILREHEQPNDRRSQLADDEDHLQTVNLIAAQEKPSKVSSSIIQQARLSSQLVRRNSKMSLHSKFGSTFYSKNKQSHLRKSIYTNSNINFNTMQNQSLELERVQKNIEQLKSRKLVRTYRSRREATHQPPHKRSQSDEQLSKIHGTLMRSQRCIIYPTMSNVKIPVNSQSRERLADLAQSLKLNVFNTELSKRKRKMSQSTQQRYCQGNRNDLNVRRIKRYRYRY